jgi:predicted transcriptional regulator
MTLKEVCAKLDFQVMAGTTGLGREVTGGYASDLLSDVIANAREGDIWVTLHRHPNIVAVAVSGDLAGIALVGGREPEASTLEKAEKEGVPILVSSLPTFELVAKLHGMGISGKR